MQGILIDTECPEVRIPNLCFRQYILGEKQKMWNVGHSVQGKERQNLVIYKQQLQE